MREKGKGDVTRGAGWGLQMGRKHFQGICLACHSLDSSWKSQTVVITGYWNLDSRIQVVLSFASGLPLQDSLRCYSHTGLGLIFGKLYKLAHHQDEGYYLAKISLFFFFK